MIKVQISVISVKDGYLLRVMFTITPIYLHGFFFSIFQLFSLPKLRAQVYFFPRNIIFIRHPDLHEDFVINAVVVDVLKSNNSEDWMVWLFRNITIIMI